MITDDSFSMTFNPIRGWVCVGFMLPWVSPHGYSHSSPLGLLDISDHRFFILLNWQFDRTFGGKIAKRLNVNSHVCNAWTMMNIGSATPRGVEFIFIKLFSPIRGWVCVGFMLPWVSPHGYSH
ncbi:MAG: hypothetical protein Q7W54_05315 [Bacteroidota bacterium]|nr:hypothetical protein [Bacteroidota bacterium]